jgi:hypothetical protein
VLLLLLHLQVRTLGAMYKELHAQVKQEVAAAKTVFSRPDLVSTAAV